MTTEINEILDKAEELRVQLLEVESTNRIGDQCHEVEGYTDKLNGFNECIRELLKELGFICSETGMYYTYVARRIFNQNAKIVLTIKNQQSAKHWMLSSHLETTGNETLWGEFKLKGNNVVDLYVELHKLITHAKSYKEFIVECSFTITCKVRTFDTIDWHANSKVRDNIKEIIESALQSSEYDDYPGPGAFDVEVKDNHE